MVFEARNKKGSGMRKKEGCSGCEKYAERIGKYEAAIQTLRNENEVLKETVDWWVRSLAGIDLSAEGRETVVSRLVDEALDGMEL
ncbi:hypothetical protein LCGC14_0728340 [marine sediment metagenome]|uniref:Uncharacterized protein n=1 Tax=marine sediment metagenome TaxID=412755 RepID=A0A0F9QEJ9_9ZZZZ